MAKEIVANFNVNRLYTDPTASIPNLKLGETLVDPNTGRRYGYGRVGGAFSFGQVIRSAKHADLTVSGSSTTTSTSSSGGNTLVDSGAFKGKRWIRGAIGFLPDTSGYDSFYVRKVLDDDTIEVVVISNLNGPVKNGKWTYGVSSGAKYNLAMPGVFFAQDSATKHDDEGFSQVDATAKDIGKYVYIPRTGLVGALIDGNGRIITAGEKVRKTSEGLIEGMPSTLTVDALNAAVGVSIATTMTGSTDDLPIWINAQIPDPPHNFDQRFTENPYNFVEIGPN